MNEKPIRWTLLAAQKEFGRHRDTIKTKLVQAGQAPASDGTYSTKQIFKALFNEAHHEKLRKVREEANKLELENEQTRRALISVEEATMIAQRFAGAMRRIALKSKFPAEVQAAVLREAQGLAEVDFSNLDQYFDTEAHS